ncbi:hypothetical protein PQU92_13900 [Asticcacaulis sp. BYS171W]|uniref:Uncharacterized protein n=1 Tax=Asticcacaulis aquaticus TaxID=2984212 RepID=A0ABT5HWD1_9CAUL|nr:hypothetical protein [Asticcacaulis aquaticus]MDC7684375.1 hypothetical protein [Asticcacaulis aquaticus]
MTREEFERTYHEKLGDIMQASPKMFEMRVGAWLDLLDSEPAVASYIDAATAGFKFEPWFEQATRGGVSRQLSELISTDKQERDAQFIGLMRQFREPHGWHHFGLAHFRAGNNVAQTLDALNRNIVGPFARDLLRDLGPLVRDAEKVEPEPDEAIATIDPQSPAILELNDKIDELIMLLRSSNMASEILGEDKDRLSAELSASKVLIRVSRVERSIMERLLTPALRFIAKTLADQAGETAVKAALALLAAHLGINIAL